jgi:hypothetical protein
VPWLRPDDVDESNLRGVVSISLLGSLEEVGWNLRGPLEAIWSGERDLAVLTGQEEDPSSGKYIAPGSQDYAAIEAVLYHTKKLEEQYGAAPAEGKAAAVDSLRVLGQGPAAVYSGEAGAGRAVAEVAVSQGGGGSSGRNSGN